jgi:histidine ammonia-lyase
MNAAQALEYRRPLKSSNQIEEVLKEYRSLVPRLENDRYLYTDIQITKDFISHKKLNFDMQSLISISR